MTESITAFVSRDGVRLFTCVDGPEGAPWLFLSNSIAADHTMWDGQIDWLTKKYRVVRHDARGHGRSDAPTGSYTFSMLIDDIVAIFNHYDIAQATFMGLSMGAMVGIGFVLAHPERTTSFVCCDARAAGNEPFARGWDDRACVVRQAGMAGILQATLDRWLKKSFTEAHPDVAKKVADMILRTPAQGYIGSASMLKTLDYAKRIADIKVPTLFVVGADDTGAPPDIMRDMAGSVPGAVFAVVANAAHLPNVDNAAGFRAATAEFLGLAS